MVPQSRILTACPCPIIRNLPPSQRKSTEEFSFNTFNFMRKIRLIFFCVKQRSWEPTFNPWMILWIRYQTKKFAERLLDGLRQGPILINNLWAKLARRAGEIPQSCIGPYQIFRPIGLCLGHLARPGFQWKARPNPSRRLEAFSEQELTAPSSYRVKLRNRGLQLQKLNKGTVDPDLSRTEAYRGACIPHPIFSLLTKF